MSDIHLLIPMSGQGTRYKNAGYLEPKPCIPVSGTPMISRLLRRFPREWQAHFIMADNHKNTALPKLIQRERPNGIQIFVEQHDLGPGFAIRAALDGIPDTAPVLVSYCDYDFIWDSSQFESFVKETNCDACVISYRGFHPHYLSEQKYAYSRLDGEFVMEVREKDSFTSNRENEYASCGAYYFRTAKLLREALTYQFSKNLTVNGEFYTSLTVEALLRMGHEQGNRPNVRVFEIPYFFQWGTPTDLRNFEHWEKSYQNFLKFSGSKMAVDQVLMPMAGLGSRFAGITSVPKAFIPVPDKPMFRCALDSIPTPTARLGIVCLAEHESLVRKNAPAGTRITALSTTPGGQALSVEAGLNTLDLSKSVIITSCDHGIVLNPDRWESFINSPDCDAAIFTVRGFIGADRKPNAFAYVEPLDNDEPNPKIRAVSVKKPISPKPSNDPLLVGTFWFKSGELLKDGIDTLKRENNLVNNELYLDSIFECLIASGKTVRMIPLDGYICWGDPDALAEALYWNEVFCGRRTQPRPKFPNF